MTEIHERPIETVEQAEAFFKAMRCSHFHMGRDFPERSREYRELGISKKTERKWREEQFQEHYDAIMQNSDPESRWVLHSRMYNLLLSLKTDTALQRMLEVTRFLRDKVPLKDRVIVAETINGRTVRRARQELIYLAYDLGDVESARAFSELSMHFSKYQPQENRGIERSNRAVTLCQEIHSELGL